MASLGSSAVTASRFAPGTKVVGYHYRPIEVIYNPKEAPAAPIPADLIKRAIQANHPIETVEMLVNQGGAFKPDTILYVVAKCISAERLDVTDGQVIVYDNYYGLRVPKLSAFFHLFLDRGAKITPKVFIKLFERVTSKEDFLPLLQELIARARLQNVALPPDLLDVALENGHCDAVIQLLLKEGFRITDNSLDKAFQGKHSLVVLDLLYSLGARPTQAAYGLFFCSIKRPFRITPETAIEALKRIRTWGIPFREDLVVLAANNYIPLDLIALCVDEEASSSPAQIAFVVGHFILRNHKNPETLAQVEMFLRKIRPKLISLAPAEKWDILISKILAEFQPSYEKDAANRALFKLISFLIENNLGVVSTAVLSCAFVNTRIDVVEFLLRFPTAKPSLENAVVLLNPSIASPPADLVARLKIIFAESRLPAQVMLIGVLERFPLKKEEFQMRLQWLKEANIPFTVPLEEAIPKAWHDKQIAGENVVFLLDLNLLPRLATSGDFNDSPLVVVGRYRAHPSAVTEFVKELVARDVVPTLDILRMALRYSPIQALSLLINSRHSPLSEILLREIFICCDEREDDFIVEALKLLLLRGIRFEGNAPVAKTIIQHTLQNKKLLDCTFDIMERFLIVFPRAGFAFTKENLLQIVAESWQERRLPSANIPYLVDTGFLLPTKANLQIAFRQYFQAFRDKLADSIGDSIERRQIPIEDEEHLILLSALKLKTDPDKLRGSVQFLSFILVSFASLVALQEGD